MKQKTKRLELRLTQKEKDTLVNFAQQCGVSISKFIIDSSLKNNPKFLNEEDRNEIAELKKMARELINLGNLDNERRLSMKPTLDKIKSLLGRYR